MPTFDPDRVLRDLRELARRTGGPGGARRLCWTDEWLAARELLRERLSELPVQVEVEVDEAGNLWAALGGRAPGAVLVGSHLDSVPAGGWLDGALGVFGALEALREHAAGGVPEVGLRLVDWADEEGARFGRSLLGSSAAAGTLDADAVADLRDAGGERLQDVLARCDVLLADAHRAGTRLRDGLAYLELHIEQGPVLASHGRAVAPVIGTCGCERHRVVFTGQVTHAGSTPLEGRRDALAAAARAVLAIRDIGMRHDGFCTTGDARCEPGVITAVAGRCTLSLDQRHIDAGVLAEMLSETRVACADAARETGCEVAFEHLLSIPPIPFDERLIARAHAAARDAGHDGPGMASGPLHDAAEMARVMPTAMVFSSSSPGVSHCKEEDTPEPDLRIALEVYGQLVRDTVTHAAHGELGSGAPRL